MKLILIATFTILFFYKCYLAAITLGISILAFYYFRESRGEE